MFYFILVTGACPYDGDIKCTDTGRCYRSNYACDGYNNCRNGDDEVNCGNEYYVRICNIIVGDWG